ncbi:sulfatase [Haloferula helveola]|uniref:Sulfatase n=3 Tax=Haloferula helveola TaxID=490095 RepID=A0ABM7R9I3_9BACT|nr:sulfatase [Haloferula helveola]
MAMAAGLILAASVRADETPNVVIILSDDQSWTDYGFMGHEHIETPNLDLLADQSATFPRGYVPTALCRPALMSIITGLYAHETKITGNDPAKTPQNAAHANRTGLDPREVMISNIDRTGALPVWLKEKGYVSFQSGKWWEGAPSRGGFTDGMTRGFPKPGGRHGDDGLKIGREGMEPVFEFIDGAVEAKKPFFLWYAPFLPHTPHNPPKRLFDKYLKLDLPKTVARYYAMCEWFDETCGELITGLDKRGVSDNTLVIYVTDNGWIQSPKSSSYAPRSKRSPNEGGVRTPIMFRWPGVIKPGERKELCTSLDIAPTILSAAGAKAPHEFPGLDLLPALREGKAIERNTLFGESFAHDVADVMVPEASLIFRWVMEGDMKLILTYDGRRGSYKYPPEDYRPQLYDLVKDPHENHNLAKDQPETVQRLAKKIADWWPTERKTVTEWSDEPVFIEPVE